MRRIFWYFWYFELVHRILILSENCWRTIKKSNWVAVVLSSASTIEKSLNPQKKKTEPVMKFIALLSLKGLLLRERRKKVKTETKQTFESWWCFFFLMDQNQKQKLFSFFLKWFSFCWISCILWLDILFCFFLCNL